MTPTDAYDPLFDEDLTYGRPIRSAAFVNKQTGIPNCKFFDKLRKRGFQIGHRVEAETEFHKKLISDLYGVIF